MSISFPSLPFRRHLLVPASLLLVAALSGCAGLQRTTGSLPSPEVLSALPVIKLGQPKPAQGEYIVYMPASEPITAEAKVQGSLFEKPDSKLLEVKLKRDIYLYKNWVSRDKIHWEKDKDSVTGRVNLRLPGYDTPMPGEVLMEFNEKEAR